MSDFGGLRSLLHRVEPSQDAFDALVAMCREAGDQGEVERVWVPYALEHIASWPDDTRSLQLRYFDAHVHGGAWAALARSMSGILVRWTAAEVRALLMSPRVANVRSMTLHSPRFDEGLLGWIATSPHLGRLRELSTFGCKSPAGFEELVSSGLALERLVIRSAPVGDDGLGVLARSAMLETLHTLTLTKCGLTDAGVERFARAAAPRLTRLDLSSNELGERGARALAGSKGQPSFESLRLSGCPVEDGGLLTLIASGRLAGCQQIEMSDCQLSDVGVEALASMPHTSSLELLGLSRNAITRRGVQALAAAHWPALRTLRLDSNLIGEGGVLGLMRSSGFDALSRLDLQHNADEGGAEDAEAHTVRPLAVPIDRSHPGVPLELNLSYSGLSQEAIVALSRTRRLESVTSLSLHGVPFSADAAVALGSSPHLSALKSLDLTECALGDEGFEALFRPNEAGNFKMLESLTAQANGLTDTSAHVLPGVGFTQLRDLDLSYELVGVVWAERLVACPEFASVDNLCLSGCPLGDDGLEVLGHAPYLRPKLLELEFVSAGGSGLRAVVAGDIMKNVTDLHIDLNVWTDDVTRALAGSSTCQRLVLLDVGERVWSEDELKALATSPNLRALTVLGLEDETHQGPLLWALYDEGIDLNPWTLPYTSGSFRARHEEEVRHE